MLVAANHEQKKKFLGRMTAEPLVAVSEFLCCYDSALHCSYTKILNCALCVPYLCVHTYRYLHCDVSIDYTQTCGVLVSYSMAAMY